MIVTAKKASYEESKHLVLFNKINPCFGVDLLIEKVISEAYLIYEVYAEGTFLGVFLAKLDRLIDDSMELVILHASAVVDPPFPLTSILNPVFESVAIENGLKSIRVHCDKKGLDKLLEDNNFNFQESIYRKVL